MRPIDIYNAPALTQEKWWESPEVAFFGFEFHEIDFDLAASQIDDPIDIQCKATCIIGDADRWASVYAVYFDGDPIGLITAAGRSESDHIRYLVTDMTGYKQARDHLSRFLVEDNNVPQEDESANLPWLSSFYGVHVSKADDGSLAIKKEDRQPIFQVLLNQQKLLTDLAHEPLTPDGKGLDLDDKHAREHLGEVIAGAINDDVVHSISETYHRDENGFATLVVIQDDLQGNFHRIGLPEDAARTTEDWASLIDVLEVDDPTPFLHARSESPSP